MPEFSRKRRLAVLGISCLSLFMIGLDDTTVSIALPTIARSLNASVSGLQWISDAYTMVLACLLIFGGATADRVVGGTATDRAARSTPHVHKGIHRP